MAKIAGLPTLHFQLFDVFFAFKNIYNICTLCGLYHVTSKVYLDHGIMIYF